MRIRIIGSCGSGKSTLAKRLSERYGIPYYEIDNMTWDRSSDNKKYPEDVRDETLRTVVRSDHWIIEGVQYHDWTLDSIGKADLVLLLNPHVLVRDYRIVRRFVLSRTGIRPWNYKQSFANLRKMIVEWNHRYDVGAVLRIAERLGNEPIIVRNMKEAIPCIEACLSAAKQVGELVRAAR
ncbi:hypothetical protein [Cohnella sp. GCM10027633]|uniref:hypothetical protein n=1 Tax=unclassified Cohnella TaxID=2636738 RepID=UPI0036366535